MLLMQQGNGFSVRKLQHISLGKQSLPLLHITGVKQCIAESMPTGHDGTMKQEVKKHYVIIPHASWYCTNTTYTKTVWWYIKCKNCNCSCAIECTVTCV